MFHHFFKNYLTNNTAVYNTSIIKKKKPLNTITVLLLDMVAYGVKMSIITLSFTLDMI